MWTKAIKTKIKISRILMNKRNKSIMKRKIKNLNLNSKFRNRKLISKQLTRNSKRRLTLRKNNKRRLMLTKNNKRRTTLRRLPHRKRPKRRRPRRKKPKKLKKPSN